MAEGPPLRGSWLLIDTLDRVGTPELMSRFKSIGGRGVLLSSAVVGDEKDLQLVSEVAKEYNLPIGATIAFGDDDDLESLISVFERVRKQGDFIVLDPIIRKDPKTELSEIASKYSGGFPALVAMRWDPEDVWEILAEVAPRLGPGGIVFYGSPPVERRGDVLVDVYMEDVLDKAGRPPTIMYVLQDWLMESAVEDADDLYRLAAGLEERRTRALVIRAGPLLKDESLWGVIERLADFPDNIPPPSGPTNGDAPPSGEDTRAQRSAISDAATVVDHLGYDAYAQSIFELITHEGTDLPLSIAVSAAWGSGKTSLMRMIEKKLDEHRKAPRAWEATERNPFTRPCHTVWIPVWMYEGGPALWAAITREIYQQLTDRKHMTFAARYRFKLALGLGLKNTDASTILKRLWWPRIAPLLGTAAATIAFAAIWAFYDVIPTAEGVLGVTATGTLASLALGSLGRLKGFLKSPFSVDLKRFTDLPADGQRPGKSIEAQEDVRRLITLATQKDHGLVVFVDDLDRCSPARVVEAVEAINQLFAVEEAQTAFILGLDADMVAASIRVAYRDMVRELRRRGNPASDDYGFRFLGKIVQMSFAIPAPSAPNIQAYLSSILGPAADADSNADSARPSAEAQKELVQRFAKELGDEKLSISELRQSADDRAPSVEQGEWDAYNAAVAQRVSRLLTVESPDVRAAIEFGVDLLERRPRDIKRFVNAFRLQVLISNRTVAYQATRATLHQIAKWTALHMRWPLLAEEVKRQPGFLAELEKRAGKSKSRRRIPKDWSERAKELAATEELMAILTKEPKLGKADLHGLLAVN